jgi:hypothetical protein
MTQEIYSTAQHSTYLFFLLFLLISPSLASAAIDYNIKDNTRSFIFVNGTTGNVGISTVLPRAKFEVNNTAVFSTLVSNTCNGTATIDWNAGNKQLLTLNGNCTTLNFTSPAGVGNFNLKIVNTGSYAITWTGVKWPGGYAPTLTASGTDIVSFFYDGTNYYASAALDLK